MYRKRIKVNMKWQSVQEVKKGEQEWQSEQEVEKSEQEVSKRTGIREQYTGSDELYRKWIVQEVSNSVREVSNTEGSGVHCTGSSGEYTRKINDISESEQSMWREIVRSDVSGCNVMRMRCRIQ